MPKQVVTTKMCQEFNLAYEKGATTTSLAKDYGLTTSTISRYLWNPRKPGNKKGNGRTTVLTNKDIEVMKAMRADGSTLNAIAHKIGVSLTTVHNSLK